MTISKFLESVKTDCVNFNGYKPCGYIKNYSVDCNELCQYYSKIDKKVLLIKRGSIGEIIRNTPLLHRLKSDNSFIIWITDYPDIVPKSHTDLILKYNMNSISMLNSMEFDEIYSLDKEGESCSLANELKSKKKKGFKLDTNAKIMPIDDDAVYLWRNGIDDKFMKDNPKHYVEELFELCGLDFRGEKYILPEYIKTHLGLNPDKKVIGLNIGVGKMWPTRKYSKKNWATLAALLVSEGFGVILLGGETEHDECSSIALFAKAQYFGPRPIQEFIAIMDNCDAVVTCVTLGLHVAIGLGKKIVLLNNIFNRNEFHLYGHGVILEPDLECKMCYKIRFDDKCIARYCMDLIEPKEILTNVKSLLNK